MATTFFGDGQVDDVTNSVWDDIPPPGLEHGLVGGCEDPDGKRIFQKGVKVLGGMFGAKVVTTFAGKTGTYHFWWDRHVDDLDIG